MNWELVALWALGAWLLFFLTNLLTDWLDTQYPDLVGLLVLGILFWPVALPIGGGGYLLFQVIRSTYRFTRKVRLWANPPEDTTS